MNDSRQLTLSQLDRAFEPLQQIDCPRVPPAGWVRTLRTALGMTAAQLAMRLGMSRQALNDAERREAAEQITIAHLRRIAETLDCELIYALVPRMPMEEIVDRRAELVARGEIEAAERAMAPDAQAMDFAPISMRITDAKRRLLGGRWSRLWK